MAAFIPSHTPQQTQVQPLMRKVSKLLLGLWVMLAAGCQSSGPGPNEGLEPSANLVAAREFRVFGKIAIQGTPQPFTARFRWDNQGDAFDMELWGPFGQGRTRLQGRPERLSIVDGAGIEISSGTPSEVMQHTLGWQLPLGALSYWAQGRPDPSQPVQDARRGADNLLAELEQSGWQVLIASYATSAEGIQRPRRLTLAKNGYQAKLVFTRWVML